MASSLVGERTKPANFRLSASTPENEWLSIMRASMGMANARVLPDPVSAAPNISQRFDMATGSTAACLVCV